MSLKMEPSAFMALAMKTGELSSASTIAASGSSW